MITMQEKIKNFFRISNLIEGIVDESESLHCANLFDTIKDWDYEKAMYYFHSELDYLNSYCIPGCLRIYDVFVGGRKCLDPNLIEESLKKLFKQKPRSWKKIKQWHIDFENIHPFGDGNGRVGRFLMLMKINRNKIQIPEMFLGEENFEENRQKYYQWFKK